METRIITRNIEEQDGLWLTYGHAIPVCPCPAMEQVYRCGKDSVELCLRGVTSAGYAAYGKALADAGYRLHAENAIKACRFATYVGQDKTLQLNFDPDLCEGTLRIVSEPVGYLPATEAPAYTRVCNTTFTQIGRAAVETQGAPGMSYITQLADGSFVIVDGGPFHARDEADLFDFLTARTPAGQKPVIAAWFITHVHHDHMALAIHFLEDYHDQIELKLAAYNFPRYETLVDCHDVQNNPARYYPLADGFIGNVRKYWPDAPHFVIHAGQKLYLADAEIEILYTHEDQYPTHMPWINHTSVAFRITVGEKTVMILGDCEKSLCRQMAKAYGDYLKSDILQLTHHGFNGACLEINRAIDPDICLWACSKTKFETDPRTLGTEKGYDFNAYLRDESIKKREHYHSSQTATVVLS